MPLDIPTLTTPRLRLTAFDEARHFEGVAAFFADPVSATYGGPCDRQDAWRKFATYLGHWAIRGYGPWAIESLETREFAGIVGPWSPEGWPEPEITWALSPAHHGRGYATEAAAAALTATYDLFGWTTATSVISVGNAASIAVAERLGATREAEVEFRYGAAYLYRHRPPDVRP